MAYDLTKLATLLHIKTLINKIKETFATKSELQTTKDKVLSLESGMSGVSNSLNGMNSQITSMGQSIDAKIALAVSSAYKVQGSKTFAQLPTVEQMSVSGAGGAPAMLGYVYNVTDAFTTDNRFVEGAGKSYPAGTNVVCVFDSSPKLDVLAGLVDLSGYVEKDGNKVLSTNDYTTAEKTKLAGLSSYTHPSYTAKSAGLYKVTVDNKGHVSAATAVAKADITKLGIPAQDTTYTAMTAATASEAGASGLVPAPAAGNQTKYLRGDGTWQTPTNTTYSAMTAATASAAGKTGLVPAPAAGTQNKYLRGDGTWAVPTNTTYSVATVSANGLLSKEDKTKLNGINIATDAEVEEMLDELFATAS